MIEEQRVHRDLVEKARSGDAESFGELVRRHRSLMLGWADRVVRNRTKAEDVVQDALLQTLKKIGSLDQPDKFVPWLRTLVRNQALMSIRGGSGKREVAFGDGWGDKENEAEREIGRRRGKDDVDDPQRAAIGRAAVVDVRKLLKRLSERERAVIEAHLIAGMPVQEVARMLDMTSGAVYTNVSRARKKLSEARYEDEIERYVSARRKAGKPTVRLVERARDCHRFAGAYNTMASMMLVTLATSGHRNVSLTDVMGATGHAFRIQVTADIGLSGPYAYDWTETMREGYRRLGYSVSIFGGAGALIEHPDDLIDALDDLFDSLEKGIPVVAWNVNNAEFGMIAGFDDDKRSWAVTDTSAADKKLAYSRLGRLREDTEWFAAVPGRRIDADRADLLSSLFAQTARHTRGVGREDGKQQPSYSLEGETAYQTWIRLLDRQSLRDPLGAAYNAAVLYEARKHAAAYLRGMLESGYLSALCPSAVPAVTHAQRQYARVAACWEAVAKLFPLPYGADPTAPGPADRAARLLERACEAELAAADALEEAAGLISGNRNRAKRNFYKNK